MITGTATRVHGRVAARQQGSWAEQTVAPPAPVRPAEPATRDTTAMLAALRELGELRDAEILTAAEFEVQKARILAGA